LSHNDLAFWQQFGVNYVTFGSEHRKLVGNPAVLRCYLILACAKRLGVVL